MIEEGALPEQIDKVMVDFGYPMGPFAVNDLSGLDISYDTRKRRAAADPNYRKLPIRTGWWRWGARARRRARAGIATKKATARRSSTPRCTAHQGRRDGVGIEQRTFTDEEILRRLLFASVNEACKILEEGKALRASDIDVMWLNGFGFPRYRGGLMYWADGIGVREVHNQIAAWHQRYGARWRPAKLLRELAQRGGMLRELKGRMK